MKKIVLFLTVTALALSLVFPAPGESSLDILYKNVKTPTMTRTGAIADMFTQILGEPETMKAADVKGIITFGENEYIAIDVDAEDAMRLVIRAGSTAYCWNVGSGLRQSLARRAFTSSVACYYSDAEIGKAFYTETLKSGPFGFFESFDEFLDTIDRMQEAKANKRLTENKLEGDRFLALFALAAFGDSEESVAEKYGNSEREETNGTVILTCRDSELIRELSDGLEKSVILLQFTFSEGKLTECSLLATDPDGNFAYCRAYLTAIYGEPVRTDPEKTVEDGDVYTWEKDGMRIWITEIGGAMTAICYAPD